MAASQRRLLGRRAVEISVVVPVHDGEKYLAECIQSVLDQGHPSLEVLVIDNGSTDSTPEVAQAFASVRYFRLPEKGLSAALNHGVEPCQGELLGFCDADDLWTAGKLALQQAALARSPESAMVFGHAQEFLSPELEASVKARLRHRDRPLPGVVRGAMLVRRESFLRVGGFEGAFAEFIDWYMRAREHGLEPLLLSEVVLMRRIHTANMGFRERDKRVEYARVLKRGLDRRRRSGGQ